MNTDIKFPNGIVSFLETYYVIAQDIEYQLRSDEIRETKTLVTETQEKHGHCGLYSLAQRLTEEFEVLYAGKEWDGDWEEAIWGFCFKKFRP